MFIMRENVRLFLIEIKNETKNMKSGSVKNIIQDARTKYLKDSDDDYRRLLMRLESNKYIIMAHLSRQKSKDFIMNLKPWHNLLALLDSTAQLEPDNQLLNDAV